MARVAVVGAGVMGCAAAWALTERGADVTVLEQFDLDHARGSSHGRSRIVRLAYPDPAWVRLAEEAMSGWRDLEAQSGQELLGLYGLVELASSPELTSASALDACGADYRLLDPREALARGVTLPPGWSALYQPEAGIVYADRARAAFLELARRRGAQVETGHRVDSLDDVAADVVVVTAGAWVTKLVPDVPVRVTRETIAYFRREGPPMPSVVELSEATRGHAMYALYDPLYGLKAGAHHTGPEPIPMRTGGLAVVRWRPSPPGSCGRCPSTRSRSRPTRASTRAPRTSPSCSSGAAGSSSARPARATASSSRPLSGVGSPRSPWSNLPQCRSTSASATSRANATFSSGRTARSSPRR